MQQQAKKLPWQLSEYDKSLVCATYFGFTPIVAPRVTPQDVEEARHCVANEHFDGVEKAALIRTYIKENFSALPHPLALAYKRTGRKSGPSPKREGYSLHFIGSPSGIAEAALIRAALSILSEEGYKNLRLDLNCIGDKESMAIYERELHNYVKKFGGGLSEPIKESLKEDVFNLFRNNHEEMMQFRAAAPSSISFLSASSRNHFKEVLEFVEALGIEFTLAPELIGEKNHSSHTVFCIKSTGLDRELTKDGLEVLATGYRYSRLGKKMGLRKEVPMAGCSIFLNKHEPKAEKVYKELPRAKFYLVQLGSEAKKRSLTLLESLRSNRIPVHHFIGKDKLTAQLTSAEQLRVSHLIIIGHKEALDNTATIRNMSTRAQDTIPMCDLPVYLKSIRL